MTNTIGKNIKALRGRMGLNQENIACFLKVDQSLISKVENGERSLSTDMLEKLSCLFGVTVGELENEKMDTFGLSLAFRSSELKLEDLESIYAINKIALNAEFMDALLEGVNA